MKRVVAGQRGKSPAREVESTPPPLTTSSPMSPPTSVASDDADHIAKRLAVLQKRLDIEMKVHVHFILT